MALAPLPLYNFLLVSSHDAQNYPASYAKVPGGTFPTYLIPADPSLLGSSASKKARGAQFKRKAVYDLGVTQTLDIRGQLVGGVRHFDSVFTLTKGSTRTTGSSANRLIYCS